jgi:hypothetical protein
MVSKLRVEKDVRFGNVKKVEACQYDQYVVRDACWASAIDRDRVK